MYKKFFGMMVAVVLVSAMIPAGAVRADEEVLPLVEENVEVVEAAPVKGKLTVNLQVVNNNGGTKVFADFPVTVDGTAFEVNTQTEIAFGAHTVAITVPADYTLTAFGGDCLEGGSVVVSAANPQRTCGLVVDDNVVVTPPTPPVIVTSDASCFVPADPRRAGDINGDGNVNVTDLNFLRGTYNVSLGQPGYNPVADMNGDNVVDFKELVMIAQNYNTITVYYTFLSHKGDANKDGVINNLDHEILASVYNTTVVSPADFNSDGEVNFADLVILAQNYNTSIPACSAVAPNTAPVITVNGSVSMTLTVGDTYTEAGATATDNEDGNITANIVTTGSVNTAVVGTYTITYTVTDSDEATVSAIRVVEVKAAVVPEDNGNNGGNGGNGGTTPTPTPSPEPEASRKHSRSGGSSSSISGGQVLGATTDVSNACGALLTHYIKYGANNDVNDVVILQIFLKANIDSTLLITGTYDAQSLAAVHAFQLKYNEDVLKPWLAYGLPTVTSTTGYVYKTTKWKINSMICPTTVLPKPLLP
jgi:hypothetical protein